MKSNRELAEEWLSRTGAVSDGTAWQLQESLVELLNTASGGDGERVSAALRHIKAARDGVVSCETALGRVESALLQ